MSDDLRGTIAELRRLDGVATKGSWTADDGFLADPDEILLTEACADEAYTRFVNAADADLVAAVRNALPALLDAAERGLREAERWRNLALYLAECMAATAEYDGGLKATSASRRNRLRMICEKAARGIRGELIVSRAPSEEDTLRRLESIGGSP